MRNCWAAYFFASTITKMCWSARNCSWRASGTTVLTAPSGGKGLELADAYPVDMVIVDYLMPEMSGKEFVLEMRRLRPETPIIMLWGDVDIPDQVLKWVDAFVAKDRLSSHLLPAIAQLQERGPVPPHLFDA